jgi:molecular chaperone DnaK
MKADAKANEAADNEARERIEKLNAADNLIFQSEKQIKEFGDKIPADKKAPIEAALTDLKAAHEARDVAKIETTLAALNTAWEAASKEMYEAMNQQQGANPQGGAEQANPNAEKAKDSEVTDVDFEEVK